MQNISPVKVKPNDSNKKYQMTSLSIDTGCTCLGNFRIKGRNIKCMVENEDGSHLLGSTPFAHQNSFSIRIKKMTNEDIGLGAVDSNFRHQTE